MRRVMISCGCEKPEWTEAITISRSPRAPIRETERAVCEDIDLNPMQDPARRGAVYQLDLMGLFPEILLIKTMGYPERCRVIGADDILVSEFIPGFSKFPDREEAIAPAAVDMEVAPDIAGIPPVQAGNGTPPVPLHPSPPSVPGQYNRVPETRASLPPRKILCGAG